LIPFNPLATALSPSPPLVALFNFESESANASMPADALATLDVISNSKDSIVLDITLTSFYYCD
jgi:hypothetical protein